MAFYIPGFILFLISALSYTALLSGPDQFGTVIFDVHTLFFAEAGVVLVFLAVVLGVVIRMSGMREGLLQEHSLLEKLRATPLLEVGSIAGISMILGGLFFGFDALMAWSAVKFGSLSPGVLLRTISVSTMLIMLGGVTFMTSLIMVFWHCPLVNNGFEYAFILAGCVQLLRQHLFFKKSAP